MPQKAEHSKSLSLRLPNSVADEVAQRAKAKNLSVGEWLREIVLEALENPPETATGNEAHVVPDLLLERLERSVRAQIQAIGSALEESSAKRMNALAQQYREALRVACQSMDRFATQQNDIKFALFASNSLTEMLMEKAEKVLGAVPEFFEREPGGYQTGQMTFSYDGVTFREQVMELIHAELFRAMGLIESEVQRLIGGRSTAAHPINEP
jgi:hypothetical protein